MRVADVIILMATTMAVHGNVRVFFDNCTPAKEDHFNVFEPVTECPDELKLLDGKYMLIG